MAEADSTTAVVPLQTPLNVTTLAKRFFVARSTIQRRLKKGRASARSHSPQHNKINAGQGSIVDRTVTTARPVAAPAPPMTPLGGAQKEGRAVNPPSRLGEANVRKPPGMTPQDREARALGSI
jgi:hypothetical protein